MRFCYITLGFSLLPKFHKRSWESCGTKYLNQKVSVPSLIFFSFENEKQRVKRLRIRHNLHFCAAFLPHYLLTGMCQILMCSLLNTIVILDSW